MPSFVLCWLCSDEFAFSHAVPLPGSLTPLHQSGKHLAKPSHIKNQDVIVNEELQNLVCILFVYKGIYTHVCAWRGLY